MKKIVYVNFEGWWDGWDNINSLLWRYPFLANSFEFVLSENPEFTFISGHNNNEQLFYYNDLKIQTKYPNAKKIIWWEENHGFLDPTKADYLITSRDDQLGNNHFYLAHCLPFLYKTNLLKKKNFLKINKTKFCNFISSKPSNLRECITKEINQYKKVDCPGKCLNNMEHLPKGSNYHGNGLFHNKLEFIKDYKFTVAMASEDGNGYIEEKLIHAMQVNSIPIYFGAPNINKYFNTKSFINCHEYPLIEDLIEKIKELDKNEEKYLEMLNEPFFVNNKLPKEFTKEYIFSGFNRIFNGSKC